MRVEQKHKMRGVTHVGKCGQDQGCGADGAGCRLSTRGYFRAEGGPRQAACNYNNACQTGGDWIMLD